MCEKCRSTSANATWVSCENLPKDTSVASHTHTQTHSHTCASFEFFRCLFIYLTRICHLLQYSFSSIPLPTLPLLRSTHVRLPTYVAVCIATPTALPAASFCLHSSWKNINENREFSLISFCYANRFGTPPKIGIKYSIPLFWLYNSFCPTALTHCLGFTFAQESQVHGLCALFPFHCVAVDSNLIPIKYNI